LLPSRYRLFFVFSSTKNNIIYVWMNNEFCLRAEGSKSDVYIVFQKMLDRGDIPSKYLEIAEDSQALKPPSIN